MRRFIPRRKIGHVEDEKDLPAIEDEIITPNPPGQLTSPDAPA
jgi:hypothetical protein